MMDDTLSRREVLRAGAGLTGVAAAMGPQAARAQGANERLVGALIGCGGMGRGNMNSFIQHGGQIAAVCDVDSRHMAQAASDAARRQDGRSPEQIKDFRKLLERKDIDVVIIATPDHWHALPFVLACEAGKDILCEKPISHNIVEGKAMAAAAKRFNRIAQVNTWQRSNKDFVDAVHYIRTGKLGRVTTVKAWKTDQFALGRSAPQDPPGELDWDMYLGPAEKVPYTGKNGHFNWRWYWNTAGGNTGDWGVHMIDIGLLAMSKDTDLVMPTEVASFGGKLSCGEEDDRTTPDTQIAIFKFPEFVMHWQTGRRGLEYGYGRFEPSGDGGPRRPPQDILDNGTAFIAADGKSLIVWRGGWTVRDAQGNELPKAHHEDFGHYDHMRDWIECVKERRQPRSNIHSMYQTTTVCHLANAAYLTGEVVHWDRAKDDIAGKAGKDALPYGREYRKPWKLPMHRA
jgi:predicted dehydrogenase